MIPQKSKKLMIYLCISVLILVMSWEHQRNASASVLNQTTGIPAESIRLRILAHSDLPADQWLKREVRDTVVKQVTKWSEELNDIHQARAQISSSIEELEGLVQQTIREKGYDYPATVDFGQVVFPAKLYGDKLYPAGEYEGLLITIGAGQGDNWWCVLFPPLCFVDFGTGEVMDPDEEAKQQVASEEQSEQQVEVRFFVFELFEKIKSLFV